MSDNDDDFMCKDDEDYGLEYSEDSNSESDAEQLSKIADFSETMQDGIPVAWKNLEEQSKKLVEMGNRKLRVMQQMAKDT